MISPDLFPENANIMYWYCRKFKWLKVIVFNIGIIQQCTGSQVLHATCPFHT